MCFVGVCFVFFFKQKTAYEMRISDWSADVCSSDLPADADDERAGGGGLIGHHVPSRGHGRATCDSPTDAVPQWPPPAHTGDFDGRADAVGVNGALPGRMPCVANTVIFESYSYPPGGGDFPTRTDARRSLSDIGRAPV